MSKVLARDFTNGPVTKQLVKFAVPLFLANILQIVYNMVDMTVAGHVMGTVGLSAIAVGGDVTDFITTLVIGFGNAGQVIISQNMGAKRPERVGRFIGTFISSLFVAAITVSVIGLILRKNFLQWLNAPPESFDEALRYSTVVMAGLVFIYGYNAVSAILRGLGDSKHPFIFIAVSAVLNIVLDILFMAGFNWGAFGAALATVISQAVSFISCLIFLIVKRNDLGFEFSRKDIGFDREMLGDLLKLGVPMALKSAAVRISMLFTNSFVNTYGVVVSAVTGVTGKVNSIGNMLSNSLNTAGSTMVGQNIGAEKYNRVPKILLSVWLINGAITVFMVAAILLFPYQVFALFTSDVDTIYEVGRQAIPVMVIMLIACVARSGANSLINGSGNYKINFVVSILDAIILRIGLGLLLGLALGYGYQGFWYGNAISALTPFFIGLVFLLTGRWKTRKFLVKD